MTAGVILCLPVVPALHEPRGLMPVCATVVSAYRLVFPDSVHRP